MALAFGVLLALVLLLAQPVLGAGDTAPGSPADPAGAPSGGGESGAPAAASPAAPGAQVPNRMTLAGGEVTLAYPNNLALAATPEQLAALTAAPACSQPFDYCLYLPPDQHASTNLTSAGLRISRRPELTAEVSCLLAQPNGWSELQPGVLRLPAASTSRFGDLGEGAAGSYSHGEVRRLWTGANCYEFEARLVLTRFENHEPSAMEEFTQLQQAALEQELLGVTESATLAGGAAVEWPLASRSSLRAFVRLDAPGLEVSTRSPLLISGSAVGPWFFEGSFPVELVAEDGRVLASHYVMADAGWMTTAFVPFSGQLEFEVAEPTEALLVLRRDNPSGLSEHDAAVRVPVTLLPD